MKVKQIKSGNHHENNRISPNQPDINEDQGILMDNLIFMFTIYFFDSIYLKH